MRTTVHGVYQLRQALVDFAGGRRAFAPLPLAPHRAAARKATSGCAGSCPAHPEIRADNGRHTHLELERKVHDPYFFTGRERELRDLIDHPANHHLGLAACAGTDPGRLPPRRGTAR